MIHDARGRVVRRLHDGDLPAGRHTWTWNGMDDKGHGVASGIYLAVVKDNEGRAQTRRMTLIK